MSHENFCYDIKMGEETLDTTSNLCHTLLIEIDECNEICLIFSK